MSLQARTKKNADKDVMLVLCKLKGFKVYK